MSKISIDDQLYSASVGIYSTNSLFSRFKSEADLRIEENDALPGALPTHVHEFVHYLHNISTTSGIKLIFDTHAAVFMASQFLIQNEQNISVSSQDSNQNNDVKYFIDRLNYIYGEFNEEPCASSLNSSGWIFSDLQTYSPKIESDFSSYQVKITGNFPEKTINGVLRIGLTFITEGVAYDVERDIYKEKGVRPYEIDANTPYFPYLAYEHFVNHISERSTTSLERIKIGNAALMHESPSQGFVEACLELKKGIAFLDAYYKKSMNYFKSYIDNKFDHMSNHIKSFYSRTDKLLKPFEYYLLIIRSTSQKRINTPLLETLFIGKNLTPEEFLRISSNIAEHCIIQEKNNTSATLDIVGTSNSLAASSDDEIAWFYVLCSTIHFIQQHFTSDGAIVKTSDLREKKCPFSGTCDAERSEGYPETCVKFPWKFKTKNQEGVCWYSAGIKSITPMQI